MLGISRFLHHQKTSHSVIGAAGSTACVHCMHTSRVETQASVQPHDWIAPMCFVSEKGSKDLTTTQVKVGVEGLVGGFTAYMGPPCEGNGGKWW